MIDEKKFTRSLLLVGNDDFPEFRAAQEAVEFKKLHPNETVLFAQNSKMTTFHSGSDAETLLNEMVRKQKRPLKHVPKCSDDNVTEAYTLLIGNPSFAASVVAESALKYRNAHKEENVLLSYKGKIAAVPEFKHELETFIALLDGLSPS
jgi:hypothetical protein